MVSLWLHLLSFRPEQHHTQGVASATISPVGKGEPDVDTQLPQVPGSFLGSTLRCSLTGIPGGSVREEEEQGSQ